MMKKAYTVTIGLLLCLFLAPSCRNLSPDQDRGLMRLMTYMTGSFSSHEQAAADSNFFDISLEMVRIWEDREDAIWLYVEQAEALSLETPYRQRVYRLTREDSETFESAVFEFEDPLRFAGAWKENQPLSQLNPDSLHQRTGCSIFLDYQDGVFTGSTLEKACVSQLRGAAYATSEVILEHGQLSTWDRGFNAGDEQVWGSRTGPYVFMKTSSLKGNL
jgi:hypothetical protein